MALFTVFIGLAHLALCSENMHSTYAHTICIHIKLSTHEQRYTLYQKKRTREKIFTAENELHLRFLCINSLSFYSSFIFSLHFTLVAVTVSWERAWVREKKGEMCWEIITGFIKNNLSQEIIKDSQYISKCCSCFGFLFIYSSLLLGFSVIELTVNHDIPPQRKDFHHQQRNSVTVSNFSGDWCLINKQLYLPSTPFVIIRTFTHIAAVNCEKKHWQSQKSLYTDRLKCIYSDHNCFRFAFFISLILFLHEDNQTKHGKRKTARGEHKMKT